MYVATYKWKSQILINCVHVALKTTDNCCWKVPRIRLTVNHINIQQTYCARIAEANING